MKAKLPKDIIPYSEVMHDIFSTANRIDSRGSLLVLIGLKLTQISYSRRRSHETGVEDSVDETAVMRMRRGRR